MRNWDGPEAGDGRRREIFEEREDDRKGWPSFIANDPRVPRDVRAKGQPWGPAKDEFADNRGWTCRLDIRESRRSDAKRPPAR